ncbi:MAG: FAD-dependent oxidoreductase, partial [bacterium]
YTGNGVGPSHLAGKVLASLVLEVSDELTRLPLVNPEPQRVPGGLAGWIGGSVIRNAMVRREAAEDMGQSPASVDRLVSEVPELIGFHIGR